ncbi:MAG: circadian clock KaiB family protein [Mycobacterium sp.]
MGYRFTLFVNGERADTADELARLRQMLDRSLTGGYDLEVIDVMKNPEAAIESRVRATPLLIRELPEPVVKVLGSLCSRGVLAAFGIEEG